MKYFYHINGFRAPYELLKLSMQGFIKQILILSPAKPMENEFFYNLHERYSKAIEAIEDFNLASEELDNIGSLDNIPDDVVISCADKNVATVIVPIEWYIEEYARQQEKGGFETINLSCSAMAIIIIVLE